MAFARETAALQWNKRCYNKRENWKASWDFYCPKPKCFVTVQKSLQWRNNSAAFKIRSDCKRRKALQSDKTQSQKRNMARTDPWHSNKRKCSLRAMQAMVLKLSSIGGHQRWCKGKTLSKSRFQLFLVLQVASTFTLIGWFHNWLAREGTQLTPLSSLGIWKNPCFGTREGTYWVNIIVSGHHIQGEFTPACSSQPKQITFWKSWEETRYRLWASHTRPFAPAAPSQPKQRTFLEISGRELSEATLSFLSIASKAVCSCCRVLGC